MRYWIYWNDLVQGPFDLAELRSLRAFTADLPVCEESSQEWSAAAAVPELIPYFQTAPLTSTTPASPPPPPPPVRPPSLIPLQGEFLSESTGQATLFDFNGTKSFVYRPAEEAPGTDPSLDPWRVTAPFRFFSPVAMPLPEGFAPHVTQDPAPTPLAQPVSEPRENIPTEGELGVLEPENVMPPELKSPEAVTPMAPPPIRTIPSGPPIIVPLPASPMPPSETPIFVPPPLPEPLRRDAAPSEILPPPVDENSNVQNESESAERVAPPVERPEEQPVEPPPTVHRILRPEGTPTIRDPRWVARRPTPRPAVPLPELDPYASRSSEKTRLWPWVLGGFILLGAAIAVLYFRQQPVAPVPVPRPVLIEDPVPEPVVEERLAPPPPPPAPKPVVKKKPKPVVRAHPKPTPPQPKPKPLPVVPEPAPKPVVMPGLAAAPLTVAKETDDPWKGRDKEAIDAVFRYKIYDGKRTIGDNARMMMEGMHEKELLHAADSGERLYLPDKISWAALREDGARYRVYLNFLAWNAAGERVQTRSDQFIVDLEKKTVAPADDACRQKHFDVALMVVQGAASAKASDIEALLAGVDSVNKLKLHAVIMKSDKQKDEKKKSQTALQAAEDKLQRQVVYFRTKYAEKTLQNIGKAYGFSTILAGK